MVWTAAGRALLAVAAGILFLSSVPAAQRSAAPSRVIFLSVDAGAQWIVDRLRAEGRAPTFDAMAREGAAAGGLISAFPSLTAPAHATLWTGTWPRAHGVHANSVSILPRRAGTVLQTRSGFESGPLQAEPIWITAAAANRRTLVLQATAGYPFTGVHPDHLLQFDTYGNRLVSAGDIHGRLDEGRFAFAIGDTSLSLERGEGRSLRLWADGRKVVLRPGREGSFTPPLPVRFGAREVGIRFRLLEYSPADGAFRLWHGIGSEITSSHPARLPQFRARAGAIIGEHFVDLYRTGRFGPTIAEGGDGEAEWWLADFAKANQEYFTGSVDFAAAEPWDLLVVYIPNFDAVAHALVGMLDPASARYSPALAGRVWPLLADLFDSTVQSFVADLRRRFPGAALVIGSDHGMEGAGRLVRPNVALRQAGLLALDQEGRIDLARTKAVFRQSKGNMLFVNTMDWQGGVVPLEEREAVKRAAAAALLGIRDPVDGQPAIRAVFDSALEGSGLGIGGEAAGDLYFDPSPGYHTRDTAAGEEVVIDTVAVGQGIHGMAPWREKLHGIFYAVGPAVRPGVRLGTVSAVDLAPTVSALLGIPPPADAVGRPLPIF
jgi:predicted AlkP superfamily phosphohydrolase/phosphomutase